MSLSASVAATAAPTLLPAAVFSATLRVAVSAENAGCRLASVVAETEASFTVTRLPLAPSRRSSSKS